MAGTKYIPAYYACASCANFRETCVHEKKYQGIPGMDMGNKLPFMRCCLAPIGVCCHTPSFPKPIRCLFCPRLEPSTALARPKKNFSQGLSSSSNEVNFDSWHGYLSVMERYYEASRVMPRLREFLIWVAENRSDVTIQWYNLHQESIRDLYEVFKSSCK